MLLTIHDSKLKKVAFIDNNKQGTLNYFNDTWTRCLDSGSSTFEFTVFKKSIETDSQTEKAYHVLNDKSFVSFRYKKVDYLFNVMQIEEDEETITCFCENLNLELLLEYAGPYAADKAMTFKQYLEVWDMLKNSAMVIGTNEVSDKKLTLEWTGSDTNLKRLLSIANYFEAEVEFRTVLNPDSTLRQFQLNIYHANDGEKYQGVGTKRDTIIKYGRNIKSITRTMDKTGIWNAVRPSGTREVTKKVAKETENTTNANATVSTPVTQAKKYDKGDLGYAGHKLSANRINKILDLSRQFKLLPSGVICQLYLESWWGDSPVAKADNNWSGMTGGAQTRPSGIKVTTGTARPANEGSTYMHYASVDDFLYDYMYLLGPQGNGYKTSGVNTFDAYVKGLFTVGGARYNYAASGYNKYITLMNSIRTGVNQANNNMLDHIDSIYKNPGTTTKTTTVPTTTNSKLENMVKWYEEKKGKVTYSMSARNGPNSYDCSSSGYYAMKSAGFTDTLNYAFSTETCHSMLTANGFELIKEGTNVKWTMQRGDIIIWGKKGYSAGSGGHYMVAYSATDIIHCNGAGITINNYASYSSGRSVYVYVYRLKDAQVSTTNKVQQETVVTNVATKVKAALAALERNKGVRLGNGQCYGLVSYYVHQIGGPGLGAGYAMHDLISGGWGAAYIGTDFNWSKHGWKVKTSGIAVSDLQAGVVANIKPNNAWAGTGSAGHTAVVKSVSGSNIVIIEQNYAGRQYCLQNTYNINQYLSCLQSICIPPELVAGATVEGKTTTSAGKATTESYTTTEIVYEEVIETETFYIDDKTYKEWKNDDGVVEFYVKNGFLYAPLSKEMYPSVLSGTETGDNWIRKDMTVETASEEVLISTALRELKKNAYPSVEYEVNGYIDVDIGDTVRIDDDGFAPKLLLQARVSEQHISFSKPTNNKTVFSNFKALENKISSDLISRMNQMFEESKPYQIRLETDNGVAFKNHEGQTTLTPTLLRGGKEYDCQWDYTIDGVVIESGSNITITAEMVPQTTVLTVSAIINGNVVATEQLSFINADDGDNFDINSPEVQEFRDQINETLDVRTNQALEDAKDYANAKSVEARDALDRVARTLDEKREALESKIRAMLDQADEEFESEKLENLKRESEMADNLFSEFTSEYESISLEVANNKSEAESLANRLNNSLNSEMSSELLKVANSLKADDDRLKSNYFSLSTNLRDLSTSASNLSKSTSVLQSQVTSEKTRLNSTASELVKQANSQSVLNNKVTTLTSDYNSTKTVTSELSKSLTGMNGSLTAVTNRTKVVEDSLSGLATSYSQTTATVSALTGKVDTVTEKTAVLESGLNGVNERFNSIQIGSRNILRNSVTIPMGNYTDPDGSFNGKWQWSGSSASNGTVEHKTFNRTLENSILSTESPVSGVNNYVTINSGTVSSTYRMFGQALDRVSLEEPYTFSFYARKSSNTPAFAYIRVYNRKLGKTVLFFMNQTEVTNTDWKRYHFTFNFTVDTTNLIQVGIFSKGVQSSIDFTAFQLEKGSILSDWRASEYDFEDKTAEYIRDNEQNLSSLSRTVETVDGKVDKNTTLINQTASGINTRLTSLESYKDSESSRANSYFTAAKNETAKQIAAERTATSNNYVAKATYEENVKGTTRTLSETSRTLNSLSTSVTTATTRASEALTKANSASTTASNAQTTATNAANTANTAKSTADNALSTANTAKQNAETVTTNLATYQQTNDKAVSDIRKTVQTNTSDVTTLKTSVANVTQTANSLKTEIQTVESKIPTEIGARNLLRNTSTLPLKTGNNYSSGGWEVVSGGNGNISVLDVTNAPNSEIKKMIRITNNTAGNKDFAQRYLNLEVGENYTISFYARVPNGGTGTLLIRDWTGNEKDERRLKTTVTSQTWKRFSAKFKIDSATNNSIQFGVSGNTPTVDMCGFQFEKGNTLTDYHPAPWDNMQEIESAKTTFTQTANEIKATVTHNKQTLDNNVATLNTSVQQLLGSLNAKVSNQTFNNLSQLVSAQATTLEMLPDEIDLRASKITTGIRNLAHGTENSKTVSVNTTDFSVFETYWFNGALKNKSLTVGDYLSCSFTWIASGERWSNFRVELYENEIYRGQIGDVNAFVKNLQFNNAGVFFGSVQLTKELLNCDNVRIRIDNSKGSVTIKELTVTKGRNKIDWQPAPENNVYSSSLTIKDNGIVMKAGKSDIDVSNAIGSMFSVNQNAINLFSDKIQVKGAMIVDGSIQTKHITTNAIQTQHIQSSAISSDKIATEAITADKIKSKAITGAKIEAGTIESAHIKTGTIEGSRIKAGTITGNLLAANTVEANNIAAGAITSGKISTVGLSADVIKGGTIVAKNGETTIGLNDGLVSFLSNYTGVRRVEANAATMGLRFNNHNVTVNGSNRILSRIWLGGERREGDFSEKWGEGGFSGIVTETIKGTTSNDDQRADRVSIVADRIRFVHSFSDDPDTLPVHGWQFETYKNISSKNGHVILRPYGDILNNWSASTIYSGDIQLCSSKGQKGSLREILVALKGGFQHIINGGTGPDTKAALNNTISYINQRL